MAWLLILLECQALLCSCAHCQPAKPGTDCTLRALTPVRPCCLLPVAHCRRGRGGGRPSPERCVRCAAPPADRAAKPAALERRARGVMGGAAAAQLPRHGGSDIIGFGAYVHRWQRGGRWGARMHCSWCICWCCALFYCLLWALQCTGPGAAVVRCWLSWVQASRSFGPPPDYAAQQAGWPCSPPSCCPAID